MEFIKNTTIAMTILAVMTSIAVGIEFVFVEVLRSITKKIKPDIIKDEIKLRKVLDVIGIVIFAIALLLAKPYVVGFIENLGK